MYGKELVVPVYLKNGKAAVSPADDQPYGSGDAAALAVDASNHGADAILVFDFSSGDAQHDVRRSRRSRRWRVRWIFQSTAEATFGGWRM